MNVQRENLPEGLTRQVLILTWTAGTKALQTCWAVRKQDFRSGCFYPLPDCLDAISQIEMIKEMVGKNATVDTLPTGNVQLSDRIGIIYRC